MVVRFVTSALIAGLFWLMGPAASAQRGGPLSAIDWLSVGSLPAPDTPGAWPVTPPSGAVTGETGISVRPLDALRPEAVGLFPAERVGLPTAIWGQSSARDLVERIEALPVDMLPALRDQAMRLLLAEFAAPLAALGADDAPAFLLARIDALVAFGALDQAAALLDALDSPLPLLRLRRFDIGLLLGDENSACRGILMPQPPIGNDPALVFCLAREGAWPLAEETLAQGVAANRIDPYLTELLTHFLTAEENLPGSATLVPPPSGVPSPLVLRLRDSLGDVVTTQSLPVAYAHADLRGTMGWRAQIDAAERLVRAGALPPNRLLGLYTERRAAASGGIWERVSAIERLDRALTAGNVAEAGAALLAAWPLVQAGELEVAMATLFALPLSQMALQGPEGAVAFRLALLSDSYETAALALDMGTADPEARFLATVARGLDPLAEGTSMPGPLAAAVATAFGPTPELPDGLAARVAEGRLGEEILSVLAVLGGPGDPRALSEGLGALRALGLEDIARRAALQSLILERNG